MSLFLLSIAGVSVIGGFFAVKRFIQHPSIRGILIIIVWSIILFFAVYPKFAHSISSFFGLGENLNTLIFAGFVSLFYINIQAFRIIESLKKDITNLVRVEALKNFKGEIDSSDTKKI